MTYVTFKVSSAHSHTGESGIGQSYVRDNEQYVELSEEDLINARNKYLDLKDEEKGLSFHKLRMFGLIEKISEKISISNKDPNLITYISIRDGSIEDHFGKTKFFSAGNPNKSIDPTYGLEDLVDDKKIYRDIRALYVTGGSNDVKVIDPSKIYTVMGIDNPYRNIPIVRNLNDLPDRPVIRNLNDIQDSELTLEELCKSLPDRDWISSLLDSGWSHEGIAVEYNLPLNDIYESLGIYE
jgi:hypothetical protein